MNKSRSKSTTLTFTEYVNLKRSESKEFKREINEHQQNSRKDYFFGGSDSEKPKIKSSASLVSLTNSSKSAVQVNSRLTSPRLTNGMPMKGKCELEYLNFIFTFMYFR
jgi:hypothetical protein